MSKTTQSRSGLGTYKRDFGPSSSFSVPKSSQEIPWPPTPPAVPAQPTRVLSGSEKRLKEMQDALAGYSKPTPPPAPLTGSKTINKRPSPTGESSSTAPVAKRTKRILPPDWHDHSALTRSSFTTTTTSSSSSSVPSSSSGRTSANSPASSAPPPSKGKLAPVFLSQEQTQILKLVQDGVSLFYTGSAG